MRKVVIFIMLISLLLCSCYNLNYFKNTRETISSISSNEISSDLAEDENEIITSINAIISSDDYKNSDILDRQRMILSKLQELHEKGIVSEYSQRTDTPNIIYYVDSYGYKCEIDLEQ